MAWERLLGRESAQRRIPVRLRWRAPAEGFALEVADGEGHVGQARAVHAHEPARDAARALEGLKAQLGRLGGTLFEAQAVEVYSAAAGLFVPSSLANALRREAVAALEAAREAASRACRGPRPWSRRCPTPRTR